MNLRDRPKRMCRNSFPCRNRADYAELPGHCQEESEGACSAWKYVLSLVASQNHHPPVRTLKSNARRNAPFSLRRVAPAGVRAPRDEGANDRPRPPVPRTRDTKIDLPCAASPGSRVSPFTALWRRTFTKLYRSILLSERIARKKHAPPACARRTARERNAWTAGTGVNCRAFRTLR